MFFVALKLCQLVLFFLLLFLCLLLTGPALGFGLSSLACCMILIELAPGTELAQFFLLIELAPEIEFELDLGIGFELDLGIGLLFLLWLTFD